MSAAFPHSLLRCLGSYGSGALENQPFVCTRTATARDFGSNLSIHPKTLELARVASPVRFASELTDKQARQEKPLWQMVSCACFNGVPQGTNSSLWIRICGGDSISGERLCCAHPAKTLTIPAHAKDKSRGLERESIGASLPLSGKTRALLAASFLHFRAALEYSFEEPLDFIQSFHWIDTPPLYGHHPRLPPKA